MRIAMLLLKNRHGSFDRTLHCKGRVFSLLRVSVSCRLERTYLPRVLCKNKAPSQQVELNERGVSTSYPYSISQPRLFPRHGVLCVCVPRRPSMLEYEPRSPLRDPTLANTTAEGSLSGSDSAFTGCVALSGLKLTHNGLNPEPSLQCGLVLAKWEGKKILKPSMSSFPSGLEQPRLDCPSLAKLSQGPAICIPRAELELQSSLEFRL